MSLFSKLGLAGKSRHEKAADKYFDTVRKINALGEPLKALSDAEVKQYLIKWQGQPRAEIDKAIPEIFAAVREAATRTIKMRHFDVQLTGGLALLKGNIAEMKTGEGKTLVATLPLVVNALAGEGAHLVTVNDYLASRDAEWMGPIYNFLGLTVGVIETGQTSAAKRAAYASDITYGTNNEFGFDYLRDNMSQSLANMVQRRLYYALIDEVDSILIDEARTPLIISAPDAESTQLYSQFAGLVPTLEENKHYNVDEKRRAVTMTDDGISFVEERLGIDNIYADKGVRFVHHLEQALRARTLYHRDKDYVVKDNQVIIVDEFTGRLMAGRRYSEGLHQALEAKERVSVQQESRTLASITFQNYFRLYERLAGMTGTAVTSAEEFEKVYNLDVVVIPTNQPAVRHDKPDRIYINEPAKFKAVVNAIKEYHGRGQPVLVGTIAIEKSEYLSTLLQREGVTHEVLNAKHHAREAQIVSQAGQKGAVTISTNMAGRGTDIKLGPEVPAAGGLAVLGTERHEARRIDNQLRGRAGRQGDPGESQFYVSMEDDVMRIFGGERMKSIMQRLKVSEDEAIENKLISRALEGAQERVEGHYFDMRKQVLSYDDVMNRQRNAIYTLRRSLLADGKWKEPNQATKDIHDRVLELIAEQSKQLVAAHTGEGAPEGWSTEEIAEVVHTLTRQPLTAVHAKLKTTLDEAASEGPKVSQERLSDIVNSLLAERLQAREREMTLASLRQLEIAAALRAIDLHWMDHLDTMDYLRTGIGLRGYGQRDPLVEYQKEGHRLFSELISTIKGTLVETIFHAEAVRSEQTSGQAIHQSATAPHRIADAIGQTAPATTAAAAPPESSSAAESSDQPLKNPYKNVGRNDPCPCGATKADGTPKKFKHCHGR